MNKAIWVYGGAEVATLRIHFTAEDLGRVTVADGPDPLWEILLSRFRLRDQTRPPAFRAWLHELRADPGRVARMQHGARLLDVLAPAKPYFPDFLTPVEARHGLDAGLEAVCRTPKRRLAAELRSLAVIHRLPAWTRLFADGDITALTRLADALRAYYQAVVRPYESVIRHSIAAELAYRSTSLLNGGVEGLFEGMAPLMRWRSPILEVTYDVDRELRLNGRGLRLVSSYFCQRTPVTFADDELQPTLIYPVDQRHRWNPHAVKAGGLTALMGANRSAALAALKHTMTTTQLARTLRISPGAASRHATVLREAGLIDTSRDGISVLHNLTPLGAALLEGRPVDPGGCTAN